MAFTANFTKAGQPPINFPDVVGYRVSAQFTPGIGFQGDFFITVVEKVKAVTQLDPIKMMDNAADFRGSLVMVDTNRSYTFNDIDLLSVLPVIDRGQRRRLLEFQYDATVANNGLKATVGYSGTKELDPGDLKEDYLFALGEAKLELLGFTCRQAAAESPVYRLQSLCSARHTWLKTLLSETKGGADHDPSFTVKITQADLKVSGDNIAKICVDESWGEALAWQLPSLLQMSGAKGGYPRHDQSDLTPEQLLAANGKVGSETVGTLTIVYDAKKSHNIPIK